MERRKDCRKVMDRYVEGAGGRVARSRRVEEGRGSEVSGAGRRAGGVNEAVLFWNQSASAARIVRIMSRNRQKK